MGNMSILDIVFPKVCSGCGREGSYICDACQRKIILPEQICPMCCKPSLEGWTHTRCKKRSGMERLIVGLPYRGMVQQCLKKVKYKCAWEIISFLYGVCKVNCGDKVSRDLPGQADIVITSVPMWPAKERTRGFNQAEIVADLVCESLPGVARKVELLKRVRETAPMFGLKKKERRENVEGAFKVACQQVGSLMGKRAILVDDVWTTGATMRECAKILKQGGAESVWGLTLAR